MRRQCQAITMTTTYSDSHRCLKNHGIEKSGRLHLCAHHRAQAARAAQA